MKATRSTVLARLRAATMAARHGSPSGPKTASMSAVVRASWEARKAEVPRGCRPVHVWVGMTAANQAKTAATATPKTTHKSQARRVRLVGIVTSLLSPALERADGVGDVTAQLFHRAAVGGRERLVALLRRLLAHGGTAGLRRAVRAPAHRPDRVKLRHLAGDGLEALNGDDRAVVEARTHRLGGPRHARRAQHGHEVLGHHARDVVLERGRPPVELIQPHAVRAQADHD